MLPWLLMIIVTLLGATGALFLKQSTHGDTFRSIFHTPKFYAGGALYAVSAVLNVIALSYLNYTVALPFTAITYIWTMILAGIQLHEILTLPKILGVTAILGGVVLIAL